MNCIAFEKIVVELARGAASGLGLEPTTRQSGLQHAQSCVRCARRLQTEQTLQRTLRAVATSDQALSAPAAVEKALLAAFRAHDAAAPAAPVIVPTFQESALKLFFRRMKWAFAPVAVAAAVALLAFAFLQARQPTAPLPQESAHATPAATETAPPSAPEPVNVPQPEPEERPDALVRANHPGTQIKANPGRRIAERGADRVTVEVGPFELAEPETVSTKDFLVFDYAQNLPPADSVQLMRVRMPRERLAPLGIPMPDNTRTDEFVNADFLVGSDGVPRAIRVAAR